MTPRMVHALEQRRLEEIRRQEFQTGIIASCVANFGWAKLPRPLGPEQFMLHRLPEAPPPPVTGEDIMAALAGIRKRRS